MVGSVCVGLSPVNGTLLDLGGGDGGGVSVLTVLALSLCPPGSVDSWFSFVSISSNLSYLCVCGFAILFAHFSIWNYVM